MSKGTYCLHSKPISEASQYDLLTNTELWVVFPRWPSIGFKTGSSQTTSCSIQSYFSEQCTKLIEQRETLLLWDLLTSRECLGGWYESNLFALQGNVYVLKGNVFALLMYPPTFHIWNTYYKTIWAFFMRRSMQLKNYLIFTIVCRFARKKSSRHLINLKYRNMMSPFNVGMSLKIK